jgi:hypothetical protein
MKVTSSLRNEKSILAKLMSTENIDVRHAKVPTAAFDPKNRVLYLPIWKEMNSSVYDLFVCHEVGHALWTPEDGWHTAACERGPSFKGYLNIIEDVRIERKIKLKYPGAKAQMYKGYRVLVHDLDFFGLHANKLDVNTMNFIDRINVHYKSGATEGVKFSDDEMDVIERLDNLDSWDDVIEIANMIYEADKESETEMDYVHFDKFEMEETPEWEEDQDSDSDCGGDDGEKEDSIEDYKNQSSGMSTDWMPDLQEEKNDDGSFTLSATENDIEGKGGLRSENEEETEQRHEMYGGSAGVGKDKKPEPFSFTDREHRENEEELVDEDCKDIFYCNAPKPRLENSLISYKRVQSTYDAMWAEIEQSRPIDAEVIKQSTEIYINMIRRENQDIVSYLCKEFEMKKRAHQYKRERLATSGRIDMNRLHQYKTSDNIFKRVTAVPDGKNHGLVMYVDYSGSMCERIVETVIQTFILIEFCRRVGIPYRVVSFTDFGVRDGIQNFMKDTKNKDPWDGKDRSAYEFYDLQDGDAVPSSGNIYLVEWFHDKMSAAQHKQQLVNWFAGILQYDKGINGFYGTNRDKMTPSERRWEKIREEVTEDTRWSWNSLPRIFSNMWGTPLNDAILHGAEYAKQFSAAYKIEHLHSIFLTDGDSSGTIQKANGECADGAVSTQRLYGEDYRDRGTWIGMLYDKKTKSQYNIGKTSGFGATEGLLKYYKDQTKSQSVIGFHIARTPPNSMFGYKRTYGKKGDHWERHEHEKTMKRKLNKDKFLTTTKTAYDQLFLIKSLNIDASEELLDVDVDASHRKLITAFKKMRSKKISHRPMLSKFMDLVA